MVGGEKNANAKSKVHLTSKPSSTTIFFTNLKTYSILILAD